MTAEFTCYGMADDGHIYFVNRAGRIIGYDPSSLTSTKLLNLADLGYWEQAHPTKTGVDWPGAISNVIGLSVVDFDLKKLRGRGAWKEKDGRICYHDGRETVGDFDPSRIFMRKTREKIGIGLEPLDEVTRKAIMAAAETLPFDTRADAIRILSWSALAPFCGALPWRPAGLITAASGSGKTFVVDKIVRPISMARAYSGETTAAGIMQDVKTDACPIIIEESEQENEKQRQNRKAQFSLMRQSTSDDTPKVFKGTADQKGVSYELKSMFLYSGISASVESVADENRIFRVRMMKGKGKDLDWQKTAKDFGRLITDENAAKLRAFTWSNLNRIMTLAEEVTPYIQKRTGKDHRWAKAEGLLLAAYAIIWKASEKVTEKEIDKIVSGFYRCSPPPQTRDEAEELVDRLISEVVKVDYHGDDSRGSEMLPLREILCRLRSGKKSTLGPVGQEGADILQRGELTSLRQTAHNYGVGLGRKSEGRELAISFSNHQIKKILGKGEGYQEELRRHPKLMHPAQVVNIGGKSCQCVIISDLLDIGEAEIDEKMMEIVEQGAKSG